ncbi:MAG: hypothetical protein RBU21_11735, partial [FCB group bacterium]|nr:hypothetical protein [FCB group bacterium]
MLSFAEQVEQEQVNWRDRTPGLPVDQGEFKGRKYAHILPELDWEKNLWEGIRSDGQVRLSKYLAKGNINRHE